MKKYIKEIFIDGLSGMATGLFATLIIGTIMVQLGGLFAGGLQETMVMMGKMASAITGAGIGCGTALRLKAAPLVVLSSAAAGMLGAFAGKLLAGGILVEGGILLAGPGEPLGAFLAAISCIYMGRLIGGKTKVDILVTPLFCITAGGIVGLLLGPSISNFMLWLGSLINLGTKQAPFLMGIIVSVLMGMILTLPISSAALGIILGLEGLAAGAATVGCCANMIGFAVASYKENRMNGLLAQGLGTSMLQIGNIVKKPIIWIPAILTSVILGPLSTLVFHMTNNPTGSGMGTAGLVGQINTYQTMVGAGEKPGIVLVKILLIQILFPALLSWGISQWMRKKGLIKKVDMELNL